MNLSDHNSKGFSLLMVTGAIGIVGLISFFVFKFTFSFKKDSKAAEVSYSFSYLSEQLERVLADPYFCSAIIRGNNYDDSMAMIFGLDITLPFNSSFSPALIGLKGGLAKNQQILNSLKIKTFRFKKLFNIQSPFNANGIMYWPIYGELDFWVDNLLAKTGEVEGSVEKKIQFYDSGSGQKKNYQIVALLKQTNAKWYFERCMLANIDCVEAPTSCLSLLNSIGNFLVYNGWDNSWIGSGSANCETVSSHSGPSSVVMNSSGVTSSSTSKITSCNPGKYLMKETVHIDGNHNQGPDTTSYDINVYSEGVCCKIGK